VALCECYAYFADVGTVALGIVYQKGEKANLSRAERAELGRLVKQIDNWLHRKAYRCSLKRETEDRSA
jgi:hypothetical protein